MINSANFNDPHQGILHKFIRYIELRDNKKLEPDNPLLKELMDGFCVGYNAVWAFAKHLSLNAANDDSLVERDDLKWFYGVIDALAQWDGISLPVFATGNDIEVERLLSLLYFFQNPSQILPVSQNNLADTLEKDSYTIRLLDGVSDTTPVTELDEVFLKCDSVKRNYSIGMAVEDKDLNCLIYREIGLSRDNPKEANLCKILDNHNIEFDNRILTKADFNVDNFYTLVDSIINVNGGILPKSRKPKEVISIVGTLQQDQLEQLIEKTAVDNAMIMLNANDHSTAIIRKDNQYYYFDSEAENAIVEPLSNPPLAYKRPSEEAIGIKELVKRIFRAHASENESMLTLALSEFSWEPVKLNLEKNKILTSDRYFIQDESQYSSSSVGNNPIFESTRMNDIESLKHWLVAMPGLVNEPNHLGHTAIFVAAMNNNVAALSEILKSPNVDINVTPFPKESTEQVVTPLFIAAQKDHLEVVQKLMEQDDINPNKVVGQFQLTPLFVAVEQGHPKIVKELLKSNKVDPNKRSAFGLSPLCTAIAKKNNEMVRLFLANENTNLEQTVKGFLPFHVALAFGTPDMVNAFLEKEFERINHMVLKLTSIYTKETEELNRINQLLSERALGIKGENDILKSMVPLLNRFSILFGEQDESGMLQLLTDYCNKLLDIVTNARALSPQAFVDQMSDLREPITRTNSSNKVFLTKFVPSFKNETLELSSKAPPLDGDKIYKPK